MKKLYYFYCAALFGCDLFCILYGIDLTPYLAFYEMILLILLLVSHGAFVNGRQYERHISAGNEKEEVTLMPMKRFCWLSLPAIVGILFNFAVMGWFAL